MSIYFEFLLSILSVWRLTHLFAREDGPFDLIFRLRQLSGTGFFGNLLDCFYCLSMWTALPFAFLLGQSFKEISLFWLALSGAACLLEKLATKNEPPKPQYFED